VPLTYGTSPAAYAYPTPTLAGDTGRTNKQGRETIPCPTLDYTENVSAEAGNLFLAKVPNRRNERHSMHPGATFPEPPGRARSPLRAAHGKGGASAQDGAHGVTRPTRLEFKAAMRDFEIVETFHEPVQGPDARFEDRGKTTHE
jgi:hypothetical protein